MNIAFYLRLSESDGDLGVDGKNESNSIENQRLLLQSYVEARDDLDGEIFEYADDGFSGTNFNRPAFRRMIEDAKKRKFDLILVKDLSRLGRDYITAGDYIEQIFPMLGVRFIAVNNNYDSDRSANAAMGFDMAINNLINTMYSRDLSRKMKSANQARWRNGVITGGRAPFGYIKSSSEKGKWDIDPEAASIVRTIFEKAIEGYGTSRIASYLNEKGYPIPWIYFREHRNMQLGEMKAKETERLWDGAKVHTILRRYEYTGALVRGRTKTLGVGSKSSRMQPSDSWIVVDGVNEAIVSKEMFDEAQSAIRHRRPAEFLVEQKYLLKSKVRCGNCGLCLSYVGTGYEEAMICEHGIKVGKHSSCCKEKYSMKMIEGRVFYSLKMLFALLVENGSARMEEERKKRKTTDIANHGREKEIEMLTEEKVRQYEAYAAGVISKETFVRKKRELDGEIHRLKSSINECREGLKENEKLFSLLPDMVKSAKRFQQEEKMTREMVETFIESVYVFDSSTIEIVFKNDSLLQSIAKI